MLTLSQMADRDNLIMKALKVSEVSSIIAKTNKGELTLRLKYEGTGNDYRFTLDAVPLEDKENKELLKLFEGLLYDSEDAPRPIEKWEIREMIEERLNQVKLPETL